MLGIRAKFFFRWIMDLLDDFRKRFAQMGHEIQGDDQKTQRDSHSKYRRCSEHTVYRNVYRVLPVQIFSLMTVLYRKSQILTIQENRSKGDCGLMNA